MTPQNAPLTFDDHCAKGRNVRVRAEKARIATEVGKSST
jgi:hypothetical protein